VLLLTWLACGEPTPVDFDTGGDTSDTSDTGPDDTADTDDDTGDTGDTGETGDTDTGPPPDPAQEICDRWNADRADLSEGSWSGSVGTCDAGDVSTAGRENVVRQVNLYRWFAGLPEVATDATRDAYAQECALMMHANGTLSHYPPSSWNCYTAEGSSAAGSSNIASGPGVMAVDMYMSDYGNPDTIGHRRWILSNGLGPIGAGSTSQYSCLWVIGGSGSGTNAWTAWPPPGIFPIQAMNVSYVPIDQTGWTVQSDSIDLSAATVTVTDSGGTNRPMTVRSLWSGYGSYSAISMIPSGWTSRAGETYTVTLSGVSATISYDVEMVDCDDD
jgi:uncharacterized protein YkwD